MRVPSFLHPRRARLPHPAPRTSLAAAALAALALSGCVSSSLGSDARDVSSLLTSRTPAAALAALAAADRRTEETVVKPPDRPLTADDAVRLALANNRDVWAALHELGIARGQAQQAGLLPNPEVEIGVRVPEDDQPLQADLGLELKISEMILVPQKQGVAEAELSAEKLRVAGEVLDLAYRARVAFHMVQAKKQRLDLVTRLLESFQASHVAAEELSRAGNIPDIDLATRKAAVESARIAAAEAELALLDAREAMNAALGLAGEDTRWTAVDLGDIPEDAAPAVASAEKRALTSSLELARIARQTEAAARKAGLARTAGILPHIEGGLHGEHDGFAWELGAHVTLGLPVFDRGQGREAAARAEVMSLRERYIAMAVGLRAGVRTALNRVESAAARARHYKAAVIPAQKKALAETILQYNAMQVGVFRVLEAEREVTGAALGYTDTLLEYHLARAALEQILAGRHSAVLPMSMTSSAMPKSSAGSAGDAH
ncbi:MAG: TolC family protein [Polyangiaceae bacterium]